MKKKLKTILAALCITVFALATLAGCAQQTTGQLDTTDTTPTAATADTGEATGATEVQDNYATVQVESIDGNSITSIVGQLEQAEMGAPPEMSSGDAQGGGTPPEMPSGEAQSGGTPPEMPSGDTQSGGTPPEVPSGDAQGGGFGGMTQFVAGDEMLTFNVTDNTAITVEFLQGSQEGTIDDIAVGSVLEVTLDSASNATDVIVKNLSAGGGFGGSDTVTNGTSVNTIDTDGHYGESLKPQAMQVWPHLRIFDRFPLRKTYQKLLVGVPPNP